MRLQALRRAWFLMAAGKGNQGLCHGPVGCSLQLWKRVRVTALRHFDPQPQALIPGPPTGCGSGQSNETSQLLQQPVDLPPSLKVQSFRVSLSRLLALEHESAIAIHELMFCMHGVSGQRQRKIDHMHTWAHAKASKGFGMQMKACSP